MVQVFGPDISGARTQGKPGRVFRGLYPGEIGLVVLEEDQIFRLFRDISILQIDNFLILFVEAFLVRFSELSDYGFVFLDQLLLGLAVGRILRDYLLEWLEV